MGFAPIVTPVPRHRRALTIAWYAVRAAAVFVVCSLAVIGALSIAWFANQHPPRSVDNRIERARAEAAELARAHREWVGDHGPGCARSVEHLVDYTALDYPVDPWGRRYELTCERPNHSEIRVRVLSLGVDAADRGDDIEGTAIQTVR
jgi:hypothetical protein